MYIHTYKRCVCVYIYRERETYKDIYTNQKCVYVIACISIHPSIHPSKYYAHPKLAQIARPDRQEQEMSTCTASGACAGVGGGGPAGVPDARASIWMFISPPSFVCSTALRPFCRRCLEHPGPAEKATEHLSFRAWNGGVPAPLCAPLLAAHLTWILL